MSRKKKHPEHVNHERWLVSYADFITLLFAFFTTLYAISTVDQKKAGKLQFSMMTAFHIDFFPGKPAGGAGPMSLIDTPMTAEAILRMMGQGKDPTKDGDKDGNGDGEGEGERMRKLAEDLEALAKTAALKGKIEVRREEGQIVVSLAQAAFFDSGRSDINAAAAETLRALTHRLNARRNRITIVVEGHADSTPFTSQNHDTNWELSAARAISVTRLMLRDRAANPADISLAGFGSYRPIASNATAQGRARNRRVDLVLRPKPLSIDPKDEAKSPSPDVSQEEEPQHAQRGARPHAPTGTYEAGTSEGGASEVTDRASETHRRAQGERRVVVFEPPIFGLPSPTDASRETLPSALSYSEAASKGADHE